MVSLPMSTRGAGGGIKIADEDLNKPCHVCGMTHNVRFLIFAGPDRGDTFYLRLCKGCLDHLAELHDELKRLKREE